MQGDATFSKSNILINLSRTNQSQHRSPKPTTNNECGTRTRPAFEWKWRLTGYNGLSSSHWLQLRWRRRSGRWQLLASPNIPAHPWSVTAPIAKQRWWWVWWQDYRFPAKYWAPGHGAGSQLVKLAANRFIRIELSHAKHFQDTVTNVFASGLGGRWLNC